MRAKTTLAQHLPADMEEKVIEFHYFVLRTRQLCGYEPSHILNMDETPMRFKLPATRTLEFTGNRAVAISSEGKWRETSKKIFKGVRQFVSFEVKVHAQYEAWMVNGPFTYMPSGK